MVVLVVVVVAQVMLVMVVIIDDYDDDDDDSNNSSIGLKYKYAVLISDKTKISSLGPVNRTLHAVSFYVGGPKRNWKHPLVGGPVVVHASAARCLLRGPFYIGLPTGIVE